MRMLDPIPARKHEWELVIESAHDHGSKDTISMCAVCGVIRHEYEPTSVGYPRFFAPRGGPISTIGGGLATSASEPACVPYVYGGGRT